MSICLMGDYDRLALYDYNSRQPLNPEPSPARGHHSTQRRPVPVTEQFIANMGCQQHISYLIHAQKVGMTRQGFQEHAQRTRIGSCVLNHILQGDTTPLLGCVPAGCTFQCDRPAGLREVLQRLERKGL